MTRILILLAFYWLGQTTLLAQPTDFAPLGARWYYSELAFAPPPFGEFPHIIEVAAKENYQGHLCSKIVKVVGWPSETVPDPLYVYSQNDSVFFYSLLSARFELLYDFTAGAGDSWVVGGLSAPQGLDSLLVEVDSVSQIVVSGQSRKMLHTRCQLFFDWGCTITGPNTGTHFIIAGIGSTGFLTPDYGLYEGGPNGLRCYTDPSNDLHFVNYPCDTTLIISDTRDVNENAAISVFPNPVSDHINILLEVNMGSPLFRLYDSFGRLVKQELLEGGLHKINIENMVNGLYFWEINSNHKLTKAGHLFIQNP